MNSPSNAGITSRRWARVVRAVVVMVMAAAGVLATPMPAHAAGTIQLSDDGVTFSSAYPGVLFDGIATIVPGDTQTEVFYVRNTGPDDGYLRLTLRNVAGDPVFQSSLTVSASVPSRAGSAVAASSANPCWVLNEGVFLAAGTTVAVTTALTFGPSSGNLTRGAIANFDIGVNLNDTAVVLLPTECGGSGATVPGTVPRPGGLSTTGAEVPIMLIGVTAFATGVGLFLIVAARRRRREKHDDARSG